MGKTGTAQYIDTKTGKYFSDSLNFIRSFSGLFPKDDPEIILYVAMKKPYNTAKGVQDIVKGLVKDISNYRSIFNPDLVTDATTYKLDNYLNKSVSSVKSDLESKFSEIIVIGNGDKIINQYPTKGSVVSVTEKIYLVTNGDEITIPNFINWSRREVSIYASFANIECEYEGTGYVYEQSIDKDTILNVDEVLKLKLKSKMKEKDNKEEEQD